MARKSLKAGALTAPLPPVLVTVCAGERKNIITIGWTGILSTHPARTYISVRPERYSYKLLRESGEFVINLATADMAKSVDYCGIYTGAKVDKFKECAFTPIESREVGAPSIAECPLSLECRVVEVIPMGTHDVFIADIVGVSCDEVMLDGAGRLCFDRANLLAYAHGEYFELGKKVGKFGFSTDKTKNNKTKITDKKNADTEAKAALKPANSRNVKFADRDKPLKTGTKNPKTDDGHRPFYLDAPRGRNNKKPTSKKGGTSANGGKRK